MHKHIAVQQLQETGKFKKESFLGDTMELHNLKSNIHSWGYTFDKTLEKIDEKLSELLIEISQPDREDFIEFLNEKTDWNICDHCGKICSSRNLIWVGDEELFGRDYHTQRFINAFTSVQAICRDCFDEFQNLKYLDLKEIHQRLRENGMLYRIGEKVFVDLSNNLSPEDILACSGVGNSVVTIKEIVDGGYRVDKTDLILKDTMLFDAINVALCDEFAIIVDEYTDRIDEYDELNTINHEGQLDISFALEKFGYKQEFIDYLKKNDYEAFVARLK